MVGFEGGCRGWRGNGSWRRGIMEVEGSWELEEGGW